MRNTMRQTSLLLLACLMTATCAAPTTDQSKEDGGNRVERRFVGVWDSHEQDIAYATQPEQAISEQKGSKGKGRGRKHWWKWNEENEDPEEPSSSPPSESSSSSTSTSTLSINELIPTIIKPTSASSSSPTSPTKAAIVFRPTYPSDIDDPVPKDSWLFQTFAPTVAAYWNYTEVLWKPCERVFQPEVPGTDCKPTCEDIHSHTILSLYDNCVRHEICAFATFVLPDSECPNRINSFQLRCPQSESEWSNKDKNSFSKPDEVNVQDMVAGKTNNIEQCKEIARKAKSQAVPEARSVPYSDSRGSGSSGSANSKPDSHDMALGNTNSAHRLQKRVYDYRKYLNHINLFRNSMITGTPDFTCARWDAMPEGPSAWCPFNCESLSRTVFTEDIFLNGTSYRICTYPVSTRDIPDERCPGLGSPQEKCPGSEEELVAFFVDGPGARELPGKTEDEIKTMLKNETETNSRAPCKDWEKDWSRGYDCPRQTLGNERRAELTRLPL